MPHLAPLSWALAPLMFWSILLFLSSILWWQQLPKMPALLPPTQKTPKIWNWQL